MSKDFIHNNILQGVADAIRYCDDTTAGIAPVDYADRIRAIDKLIPQPDALNFYMPNGGTISLNMAGGSKPTVVNLEYSLDRGSTWTVWRPDANGNRSLTLTAWQRVYIRNTSETSTGFSTTSNSYYRFNSTSSLYANGNINSLLCKNPNNAIITPYCFHSLFYQNTNIITPPKFPSTTLANNCYRSTFNGCSSLIRTPELPATILVENCYKYFCIYCSSVKEIRTRMTNISATGCLDSWISGVSTTGDFYCPAELTIPTGTSGIPSGWTRHDI